MIDRENPVPLYYQLANLIKEQIASGVIRPGDKLPSESEMVGMYNVGRLTVRVALSQLVNAGYLEKVHGKGTFCKRAEVEKKALNIDVLLDMTDVYFMSYYVKSISNVLTQERCNFIISDTRNDTGEICLLLEQILMRGSSGVIMQPSHMLEEPSARLSELFLRLRNAAIPCIMLDCAYEGVDASYTILDEYKGGCIAAQYLADLGHKRTAILEMPRFKDSAMRRDGFLDTAAKANIDKPLVFNCEKDFIPALCTRIKQQDISAIFCYNDQVAVECLRAFKAAGIDVPKQVSVLSFDDSILASTIEPGLTSIAHPKQIMGELAARVLIELIHKRKTWPYINVFTPSLVERQSCIANPSG